MPKFTIRQLLIATVIFGFLGAILSWAVNGNVAALGFGFAVLGLIVPFTIYGLIYAFVYAFANVIHPVETVNVPIATPVTSGVNGKKAISSNLAAPKELNEESNEVSNEEDVS